MIYQPKCFFIAKILFSITALVGIFIFVYSCTSPTETELSKEKYSLHNKNEEKNFDLQGFHFISFKKEKKNISISADRLIIQKQSVGFFRFALLNEVKFTNASVVLYETTPDPSKLIETQIANTTEPDTASDALSFNSIYSEAIFGLFPVKRISSIKFLITHITQPLLVAAEVRA
jgi:hypothetical protein